ncbi:adenylate and guanylate cyclase catalytic domain-containing protein, partial [Blastocladiella britannica]
PPGSATARTHAAEITECAFRFLKAVEDLDMSDQVQDSIQIRVGVHSGAAIGGVAGIVMPRFALFGDTPNIAGQMEQKSTPNRIHVSAATHALIAREYDLEARPESVVLEGGTEMSTYWLKGKRAAAAAAGSPGKKGRRSKTSTNALVVSSAQRKNVRMAE